jgi:predicted nucleic acid-binding protein
MGQSRSVVFDSGALIALERGSPFVRALLREVIAQDARILIPAGVVAQVWREGARQAIAAAMLKRREVTVIVFDELLAKAAGAICGRSGTSDIVDASVILAARMHRAPVVTSDPSDLSRLDQAVVLYTV